MSLTLFFCGSVIYSSCSRSGHLYVFLALYTIEIVSKQLYRDKLRTQWCKQSWILVQSSPKKKSVIVQGVISIE